MKVVKIKKTFGVGHTNERTTEAFAFHSDDDSMRTLMYPTLKELFNGNRELFTYAPYEEAIDPSYRRYAIVEVEVLTNQAPNTYEEMMNERPEAFI